MIELNIVHLASINCMYLVELFLWLDVVVVYVDFGRPEYKVHEQEGSLEITLLVQGPSLTEREFDIYLQSVAGTAIGKCTYVDVIQ